MGVWGEAGSGPETGIVGDNEGDNVGNIVGDIAGVFLGPGQGTPAVGEAEPGEVGRVGVD